MEAALDHQLIDGVSYAKTLLSTSPLLRVKGVRGMYPPAGGLGGQSHPSREVRRGGTPLARKWDTPESANTRTSGKLLETSNRRNELTTRCQG